MGKYKDAIRRSKLHDKKSLLKKLPSLNDIDNMMRADAGELDDFIQEQELTSVTRLPRLEEEGGQPSPQGELPTEKQIELLDKGELQVKEVDDKVGASYWKCLVESRDAQHSSRILIQACYVHLSDTFLNHLIATKKSDPVFVFESVGTAIQSGVTKKLIRWKGTYPAEFDLLDE